MKKFRNLRQEACCNDCKTDEWYSDQPEWGTKASGKKARKMTPGQNEAVQSADKKPEKYVGPDGKTRVRMVPVDKEVVKKEATTAQIRMNRALKKHGVGKNDEFYKSKMSPEARKKLEPKKRPEPAQVTKPKGKTFKWFATRDMKND